MRIQQFKSLAFISLLPLLSSTSVFGIVQDAVVIEFKHPQTIAVNTPQNTLGSASGSVAATTWTITSNNAVAINFTGTSPDETTGTQAFPQFSKQEVDAKGNLISDRYDHLETFYGIYIDGTDSIANEGSRGDGAIKTYQGGIVPTATPTQLVEAPTAAPSPFSHYGAIMPSDEGLFQMTLYSKGIGNQNTTQSGVYSTTVTAVITSEEQL
jgi:hypothetical protein